jgi:hypothetical protein
MTELNGENLRIEALLGLASNFIKVRHSSHTRPVFFRARPLAALRRTNMTARDSSGNVMAGLRPP